jgi:hypothetical protein
MVRRVVGWVETCPIKHLALLMVGIFAVSRAAYFLAGVRFDASSLPVAHHFLDPELLRTRLIESLFYLHSQPPLFNLFLGLVLKVSGHHYPAVFAECYEGMGLGLYVALFALMRRVRVSRTAALGLSTLFMLSPSFVLYEHYLFYDLPLTALLTASCLAFYGVLQRQTFWRAVWFFTLLLLLCLLRSMYHLAYFTMVAAAVLALRWHSGHRIMAAAAVPLALVVGLYTKNYLLFGEFSASSWAGMNLSGVTVRALPLSERKEMVVEGKLSPLAMVPRLSPLNAYPARYRRVPGFPDIPALREERKTTGADNLNHLAYIAISRQYLRDALYVARHRPDALLVGWLNSWLCYFRSATDFPPLYGNLSKIVPVNVLYDYLLYGKIPRYQVVLAPIPVYYAPYCQPRLYVFLLLGLPLLLVFGLRLGWRGSVGPLSVGRDQRILVTYVCANIIFVAVVGNSFEVSENHRFRFSTDPLYVVLVGLFAEWLRARWGERNRASTDW